MTITPDQADQWAKDATDGPWSIDPDYGTVEPGVISGEGCRFEASDADLALIAAAPELADTIAGMTWQIGVHAGDEDIWAETPEEEEIAVMATKNPEVRLIRRLVGPVEVVEDD